MSTITLQDEILVGLAMDSRYQPQSAQYEALAAHLPDMLLAAVGGELDAPFCFETFFEIRAAFLCMLVQDPDISWLQLDPEKLGLKSYYVKCAEQYWQVASDVLSYMQRCNMVHTDLLLTTANPPLRRELLTDYYTGRLTMRQLVAQQPGIFIPHH